MPKLKPPSGHGRNASGLKFSDTPFPRLQKKTAGFLVMVKNDISFKLKLGHFRTAIVARGPRGWGCRTLSAESLEINN